jgi:hypothetical protein
MFMVANARALRSPLSNCHRARLCHSRDWRATWPVTDLALSRAMHHHFYVAHSTSKRVRVKFPGHRHDQAFFTKVQRQLSGHEGIVAAVVNPLTASVLIEHDMALDLSVLGSVPPDLAWPAIQLDIQVDCLEQFQIGLASLLAELLVAIFTRQQAALLIERCLTLVARWALLLLSRRRRPLAFERRPFLTARSCPE